MLHGYEDDVDDDTDDNPEVKEGVRDDGMEPLFQPPPTTATVPLQEELSNGVTRSWRLRPDLCNRSVHETADVQLQ